MPYAGKTLMPRDIAAACYERTLWRNYELTKAIGVALGESKGSIGAWHDNQKMLSSCIANQEVCNPETYQHMTVINPELGTVRLLPDGEFERHPPESLVIVSRDCGVYQINIMAGRIGTAVEESLRTEFLAEPYWRPVLNDNISAAVALYNAPWNRDDALDQRFWQAWVAYTTGWVLFPEWWVWAQDENGVPLGEWHPTGRYIQKAIAGQWNFHIVTAKDYDPTSALYYAKRYCHHFSVDPESLYFDEKYGILKWHIPPMPTAPPADGIGKRPKPNDGI